MSSVLLVVASLMALQLSGRLALGALNRAEVRRHAGAPPPVAMAVMDEGTYRRAVAYTLEKSRFGIVVAVFDTGVLALALFSGILPLLFGAVRSWGAPGAAWTHALFILLAGVLLSLPSLPFDWWERFRLEERFGFNRSTLRLWIVDQIKGLLLTFALGLPLLWVLFAVAARAGRAWWLWGFALVFLFQIVMLVLYPRLIVPLFNTLTPLPEGDLRDRLMALADRTGFRASTIEVIDGSKRSSHSNAYFTGFGRFRRIVLFDTLIAQLTADELEAVLAHEIGHYRRGHVPRLIARSAAMLLAGFAAVAWLARSSWFNAAFGFPPDELAPSLLLASLLGGLVTFWLSPLTNALSRKYEYEADAFARDATGGPAAMVGALRKLAQKNLTNLTPHPWFSRFHYSHPTLVEREAALVGG